MAGGGHLRAAASWPWRKTAAARRGDRRAQRLQAAMISERAYTSFVLESTPRGARHSARVFAHTGTPRAMNVATCIPELRTFLDRAQTQTRTDTVQPTNIRRAAHNPCGQKSKYLEKNMTAEVRGPRPRWRVGRISWHGSTPSRLFPTDQHRGRPPLVGP